MAEQGSGMTGTLAVRIRSAYRRYLLIAILVSFVPAIVGLVTSGPEVGLVLLVLFSPAWVYAILLMRCRISHRADGRLVVQNAVRRVVVDPDFVESIAQKERVNLGISALIFKHVWRTDAYLNLRGGRRVRAQVLTEFGRGGDASAFSEPGVNVLRERLEATDPAFRRE